MTEKDSASKKKKKYMVRVRETFEGFAVVEASGPTEAEELVYDLCSDGYVDVVDFKGTILHGGLDRTVDGAVEAPNMDVTVKAEDVYDEED